MTEDRTAGSDKKNVDKSSSPAKARPDSVIGEIQLTFHKEGLVEVEFPFLGLLTLGRVEAAMPQIYRQLMLARAAYSRKLDGLPEKFNINPEGE